MQITIIGAGNVATHLAKILAIKGFSIGEIFSKNIENAETLAEEVKIFQKKKTNIIATDSLNFSESKSKLFILAIKDTFFEDVVVNLQLPKNVFLVHTSGSISLNLLTPFETKNVKIGVFYPLQTFSKHKNKISEENSKKNIQKIAKNVIDFWKNIPLCLQANEVDTNIFLAKIAKKLTLKVYHINSEQRQVLHLGATFACNFSNYMYHIANKILQKSELPFEILENLVKETANKAFLMLPIDAQTGAARRGDMNIITLHQEKLAEMPEIKELYAQITKHILDLYHKKE